MRSEKLKRVELQQNKVAGKEQVHCELEDGEMISKTLVEAIEPYAFEINNFCMFADVIHDDVWSLGIFKEEEKERHNLNSVLKKKDGTVWSHEEAYTQLEENIAFEHTAKVVNRGSLAYMGSQKQAEEKEDVKHTNLTLEEANKEILLLENLLRESESSHELRS